MNPQRLRYINFKMKDFEQKENHLITRIDITKKLNMADENIMDKHYVGETHNKERIWRF